MSVPTKCNKICSEGFACILSDQGDLCMAICPPESNITVREDECACMTKSGVAKRLQAGRYCVDGNTVKWPQCEDGKVPQTACYCGQFGSSGCGEATDICYKLTCYKEECGTQLPHQDKPCMCGADYLPGDSFCFEDKPLKTCEKAKLTDECGCDSRLVDPRCGVKGDGKHYFCDSGNCKVAEPCAEDVAIGQSNSCACCNDENACVYCSFGNKCVNGTCECRKAESTPAVVSSTCACGDNTCEFGYLCYQDKCYELIEEVYLQKTFDKEMLCHKQGSSDGNHEYTVIAPGKYCTVSGKESDIPMCTLATAPGGNCVCSNTGTEKCDTTESPSGRHICTISSSLQAGGYECLAFCTLSETPLQEKCACGENQGKAEQNDICMQGDKAPLLYRPCQLSHYMLSGSKGCYCSIDPVKSCTSQEYCSPEQHSCLTPPKCAQGTVKDELCAFHSLLCQRGNTVEVTDCLCSETTGIVAVGAYCTCGDNFYCGKNMTGVYFCVQDQCLPACVADGNNEPQLCACDHGKEKIIVGPSEAQKTCAVTCQGSYYYDEANNFCQKCGENCAECTAEKCLKCLTSRQVIDKTRCKEKTVNTALVAGCTVAAVVVVAIIVAVVVIVVLKKKKKASHTVHVGMQEPAAAVEEPESPKNAAEN